MEDRQQKIKEAAIKRSKERAKPSQKNQYYAVIAFFCVSMAAALIYALMNPARNFAEMQVIDDSAMLVHNGQNHRFTQGSNEFFADSTIAAAKKLFESGLSDIPNIEPCKSVTNEVVIPDNFDWREENPTCVQDPLKQSHNCTAGFVLSAISAAEDRICMAGDKQKVRLSSQELVDCDKNISCARGTVNKIFQWGKRRGFILDSCYPWTGKQGECPEDHIAENECRQQNNLYKVIDFCIATEIEGIKKEILANGPVIGQLNPYTDLLTYSSGVYSRTGEAFKFQGNTIFKIVGWQTTPDGSSAWIVENTWGNDWGENGYARIASHGETSLDFYALSFAMYPKTMAQYYSEQVAEQMAAQTKEQDQARENQNTSYEWNEDGDGLEEDVDQIFLDEESGDVIEEGVDSEL